MAITFADLSAILGQLWWPFFRVGAVFLSMPFFGDALIPIWVRSLLALSIVVITAPLMPTMPTVELFSLTSLFLAFEQAIWGLMFGLILHMLFNVFTMLGQTISLQMGLGMAMMNDPVNGLSVAILGRIFFNFFDLTLFVTRRALTGDRHRYSEFCGVACWLRHHGPITSRRDQCVWLDVCGFPRTCAARHRVNVVGEHQFWCDEPRRTVSERLCARFSDDHATWPVQCFDFCVRCPGPLYRTGA